jgi:hypothetical protein
MRFYCLKVKIGGLRIMKLFKIGSGSNPEEIKLENEKGEPLASISIGEQGRGRDMGIIPIVGQGTELRAKKTDKGIVLVRGSWPRETRCLAVINATGAYDRCRSYKIHEAKGIQTIMSGTIAFGQAGRTNSGEEVLAIVEPEAEFRLNSKYDSTWYRWTGKEWITEKPEERDARIALAEIANGEGEWI